MRKLGFQYSHHLLTDLKYYGNKSNRLIELGLLKHTSCLDFVKDYWTADMEEAESDQLMFQFFFHIDMVPLDEYYKLGFRRRCFLLG